MKRAIRFTDWDAAALDSHGKRCAPAAVRMIDGMTLESYAGSVPPDWNGEVIEVFDMFEARRLKYYHEDIADGSTSRGVCGT